MSCNISIEFLDEDNCTPANTRSIIEVIPPHYRKGHKKKEMVISMLQSPKYTITFGESRDVAEKFRKDLFEKYGNLLTITKDFE